MPYTATQTKLIRERVRAYYRAIKAQADYRFGWKDLAALIFDYTQVRFRGDSLRAIAEGQVSRGKRRGGGRENLDALVKFLTDPEIKALSLEDLQEPEIPYLFAMQLIEFLKLDDDNDLVLPPSTLEGAYRAVCQSEDGISEIFLEITLSKDGRLVHLEESSATYRKIQVDPAELSAFEKKRHLWRDYESKGWGIFTPEENMIGFMKRLSKYGGNQYYSLTANIPRLSGELPAQRLVLHAQDDPYFVDTVDNVEQWIEDIIRNVTQNNLRHFVRMKHDKETLEMA
jgi:hypothetical protein